VAHFSPPEIQVVWDVAEDIMAISSSAPAGRWGTSRRWILCFWSVVFAGADVLSAQTPVPPSRSGPGPLTLAGLLEQVSRQHPLMAAARARIRSAEGSHRAAAVLPNPVLGYQLENVRLPGGQPVPMDREAMITATFPLEFIYQRGSRVGQANADIRAAEAEAQTVRQRLRRTQALPIAVFERPGRGQVESYEPTSVDGSPGQPRTRLRSLR
jgi:hypothetical protein